MIDIGLIVARFLHYVATTALAGAHRNRTDQ
jgi:hypothetical protein